MRGHVPAQQSDQDDRHKSADNATDGFGALGVELAAKTRTDLPADEPAECPANDEAKNCQDRCANEQSDIIPGDSWPNADGKKSPNGANDSASECAHITFTKGGLTHITKVSYESYVSHK
jgi:hypothetical protein